MFITSSEHRDLAAARQEALKLIFAILVDEGPGSNLDRAICIRDCSGKTLMKVSFRETLR